MATSTASRTLSERLEPYIAIIGPMAMILAVLLFMGIAEPARYFRATNLNLILLDAALYMPMAMAMTFVITQRGIDLSIGSIAALSGILMAFLIMGGLGLVTFIFRDQIAVAYTNDSELAARAAAVFMLSALIFLPDSLQVIMGQALRALGDARN